MVTNRSLIVTAGLLLATCGLAAERAAVTAVSWSASSAGVQVDIRGRDLGRPKVILAYQGTTYNLEFNAHLEAAAQRTAVNRAGLNAIRTAWYSAKPPRVRVQLQLQPNIEPAVTKTADGWRVTIGPVAATSKKPVDADTRDMVAAMKALEADAPKPLAAKPMAKAEPFPATLPPLEPAAKNPAAESARAAAKPIAESITAKVPILEAALAPTGKPEAFPASVPPLEPAARKVPLAAPVTPIVNVATGKAPTRSARRVSVEAKNGDVVEILRGLALQASVNIITSPDTSPAKNPRTLTLTLTSVDVEEALALVTALSGLKYTLYGSTYVVAPPDTFPVAMRQIAHQLGRNVETRVIPLRSGEGNQIKEAVLRALPPTGEGGWYDVIVPGAVEPSSSGLAKGTAPAGPNDGLSRILEALAGPQPPGAEPPAAAPAPSPKEDDPAVRSRNFYLLVLADRDRLDQIEQYVRDVDQRIVESFTIGKAEDVGTAVVPVMSNQPDRIREMLQRILAPNPRASEYSIVHTMVRDLPEGEESTTVLMMVGPKGDLENLQRIASALDESMCAAAGVAIDNDPSGRERLYEVVQLRFLEPKLAEFDLKSRIRGLWVTVLPDHVTPGLSGEAESEKLDAPQDTAAPGATKQIKNDKTKQKKAVGRESLRLMLRGTREQIRQAKEYLALADVAPRQVAFELRVMDLTREDALKLGIDWNLFTGGAVKLIRLNNSMGGSTPPSNTVGGTITGNNWGGDVTASLDKIANKTNLIARPNAMAMDGSESSLFVGDVIRYVESVQAGQNGVSVTTGEVRVGVRLDVIPRIGADGSITMTLEPSVSFLRGFIDVPGGGQLPQTSERSIRSTVSIRSGDTIAIGGLIQDQDTREMSGVPILMDLPIVGQLFRRTNNVRRRTEVVVFLTARVIEQPEMAVAATTGG